MKKFNTLLLTLILAGATGLVALAAIPPTVSIKVTKKTADTHKSSQQLGRFRQRQDTYKDMFYEITVTSLVPVVPTNIVVSWAVLVEGRNGRHFVGALGGTTTNFGRVRSVEVETDDVSLEEHEVRRRIGNADVGSDIYALGIRVSDMTGKLLGEKYEPSKAEDELAEAFDGKFKDRERERRDK